MGVWLTALPGGLLTMGDDMLTLAFWHRLRFCVPVTGPLPHDCDDADPVLAEDEAMVSKAVAKKTQLRHDILAAALRLVISSASLPSAAEPRYRTIAGRVVKNQRRGDILVVMPQLRMAAVDVVVSHAPAKSYCDQAALTSGHVADTMERRKLAKFQKDVPSHVEFQFVPFAVESCGYMGKAALGFVGRLGDVAAGSGRISKSAFVRWAMQVLSVALQKGNADMYRAFGLVISREQGSRFDPGHEIPVLQS